MTPTLEQLLYLQAQQESNSLVSPEVATGLGAALGAYSGLQAGRQLHKMGQGINNIKDKVAPIYPEEKAKFSGKSSGNPATYRSTTPKPRNERRKPGNRMAGLLAGAVLGGVGGNQLREALIEESPAARLLAKIQVGAPLNATEMQVLENIATKQYMA